MGTDHTIATLRARQLPAGLADALQALVEAARRNGHQMMELWEDDSTAIPEEEAMTALLDLLAPMLRDHEAMQALREGRVREFRVRPDLNGFLADGDMLVAFMDDPADTILAAAKGDEKANGN